MNRIDAYQLLQEGTIALSEVEQRGIRIDVAYCDDKLKWVDEQYDRTLRRFNRAALGIAWQNRFGGKINYQSGGQLRAVLGADFHIKADKETESGEASADEESLRRVNVEGVEHILRMRRLKKMGDTVRGFRRSAVNGIAHPSFWLHSVTTYRSSSSGPNFQNVPVRDAEMQEVCRQAIKPSKGFRLMEVDYKGAEVSVACCYHKDPTMLTYLRDPESDMHGDVAIQMYKLPPEKRTADGFKKYLRQSTKNGFIFPEFYGDYWKSCATNMACSWLQMPEEGKWRPTQGIQFDGRPMGATFHDAGMHSLSEFATHVQWVEKDFWERRFRVYNQWKKDWYSRYQRTGEFQMLTGFIVSGLFMRNQVINYPVQGAAFHALLWVLIRLVKRLRGWRSGVVAEVHDSMLIDVHPDEFDDVLSICFELVEELKRTWTWLIAPLSIDVKAGPVDGSWANIEDLK